MIKKFGKYIVRKISGSVVGKVIKYGFWTTLCFFGPGPVIATVGIQGLVVAGIAAHSGIVEYGTTKVIEKVL